MRYVCNGRRVSAAEKLEKLANKRAALLARLADTPEKYRAPLDKKLHGLGFMIASLETMPGDHFVGRQECDHDLTAQIEAIPDDGEVYEYECPACGNIGTVNKSQPA